MGIASSAKPAEEFYASAIDTLKASEVPFMIGGAYALRTYADIYRDTKDLDVFCTPGEYPRLLHHLDDAGYEIEVTDASWLAKARQGDHYVDLIFGSANAMAPVDDVWYEHARPVKLLGFDVLLVPPEELLWQKILIQDRHRFDGADVNHILRAQGLNLDWKRLLRHMEPTWEVFLASLLVFRFVYPSERDQVPQWLMQELLDRAASQLVVPTPLDKICRGSVLSKSAYHVDIHDWGYRRQ